MFRRKGKRSNEQLAQSRSEVDQQEIVRLHGHVERLETALRDVIEASDDVLIDLRASEAALAGPVSERSRSAVARTGFAAAWTNFESSTGPGAGEQFFEMGQVDQRSRRWLLTPR